MEERNHTTAPDKAKKCACCGWGAFVVGLVVALILGWWALPNLMMTTKEQPIAYNHVIHVETLGIDCANCHFLQGTGNFVGLPTTASCAACHFETLGDTPEEARFVNDYVKTGREIRDEWLVYQKQPDNAFFSHAAHSFDNCSSCHADRFESVEALCAQCHLPVFTLASPPEYQENRLSGYTKQTMIMWECESCHAQPEHLDSGRVSNACFVCHK